MCLLILLRFMKSIDVLLGSEIGLSLIITSTLILCGNSCAHICLLNPLITWNCRLKLFTVPSLKIENNLLFHAIDIALCIVDPDLDLSQLFILIPVPSLEVFQLSQQSQLLFIYHNCVICTCAKHLVFIVEIACSPLVGSAFLIMLV